MTVSSSTSRADYTGNGLTVDFAVPFRFLEDTHLLVLRTIIATNVTTVLVLNSLGADGYSVDGAGQPSGGTVTVVTAPAAGTERLSILRKVPRTQLTDYIPNDSFPAESHERALDKLTMLVQEQGEVTDRAVVLSPQTVGVSNELPGPVALNLLRWKPDLSGLENAVPPAIATVAPGAVVDATVSPIAGIQSSKLSFLQAGTGAQLRTVEDKQREIVSVLDFIPSAEHAAIKDLTSTYDCTADIQRAIDSLTFGGSLKFPQGLYIISAVLNVTVAGTTLIGDCNIRTALQQTDNTLGHLVLDTTANDARVTGLRFTYASGTPTGGIVIDSRGGFNHIDNIVISSCYQGVKFSAGAGQKISNFGIFNYENYGILCQSISDIYISDFVMNAGNDTRALLGGIRLAEKCEGIFVSRGDILRGLYSLTTDAASYTLGNRPAYCNFTDVLFDSAGQGSLLDDIIETEFVGCWFSGGRTGVGFAGLTIGQSDSLKFTNTRFFNCGSHGLSVGSTAKRLSIVNCSANSNSFTTGAGVSHGMFFAAGTTDFTIADTTCSNGLYTGTQGYGIFISATCDNFSLRDNKVSGNATGGINDGSAAAAIKFISGNIGYRTQNKFATTVLLGATSRVGNHGMPFTPAIEDFRVQTNESGIAKGVTSIWIDTITSTQFTIRTNAAVTGSDLAVGVEIRSKGA